MADDESLANKSFKCKKLKKTRRTYKKTRKREESSITYNKHSNKCVSNLVICGTNANALFSKRESLLNLLETVKPSAILIQESKMQTKGKMKLPGYQIFERLQEKQNGGGLFSAISEELYPVLVFFGTGEIEILTIQITISGNKVRLINAYGPQEPVEGFSSDSLSFWSQLESEVMSALDNNCLVFIEMDANAKIGDIIIKDNLQPSISNNGRLLLNMTERHNLVIVNSLEICQGKITRERIFENRTERSILDYVIVCQNMLKFVASMNIDEARAYALSRYDKKQGVITSDHNLLTCSFDIKFPRKKNQRQEFFNFKNEEARKGFINDITINCGFRSAIKKDDLF